jgi:hypothetical protein
MITAMSTPPRPTRQSTIEAMLSASPRDDHVPLRNTFVQSHDEKGKPGPAPMAALVRRGVESTMEQFLLHRALASGGDFDVRRHPIVWQRALGLVPGHVGDDSGRRTVLRNWTAMRDLKLVQKQRRGRILNITALAEDGSDRPYRHPGEQGAREPYFKLSYSYWRDGYHERLTLPGKAVLLIALTLGDWFWLPPRHAPTWYGVSPSTLQRGLADLFKNDVLDRRWHYKEAPLTEAGFTREYHWILRAPFGPVGKLAKGAPPELTSPESATSSPPHQAGRPRRRSTRRTPAARNT